MYSAILHTVFVCKWETRILNPTEIASELSKNIVAFLKKIVYNSEIAKGKINMLKYYCIFKEVNNLLKNKKIVINVG